MPFRESPQNQHTITKLIKLIVLYYPGHTIFAIFSQLLYYMYCIAEAPLKTARFFFHLDLLLHVSHSHPAPFGQLLRGLEFIRELGEHLKAVLTVLLRLLLFLHQLRHSRRQAGLRRANVPCWCFFLDRIACKHVPVCTYKHTYTSDRSNHRGGFTFIPPPSSRGDE